MTRLLLIMLLMGNIAFGQVVIRSVTTISKANINGDSVNNSPNQVFNDKIKLVPIDKSSASIDIRLYHLHFLSNTKTLRRLFLVDSTWNAVEYSEWNKPVKIKKYKLKATFSFDSLFLRLLSYNILTLPNQSDLEGKMHKDVELDEEGNRTERKIAITDGEGFTIEIKVAKKFRVYQFEDPDIYSKLYDNVSELKDYLNIIQSFEKVLYRK